MADHYTITIIGRRAWWVRPALAVLKAWVLLTRRMPSDALIRWIGRRAVRTSIVTKRGGR
ncbi:hypothetical protein [Burkholderia gladioli]|uniref:hypothetical protein n=1 Tax=Burkholderia gladioli TaxID=28095 RepID=UPI00163F7044|nr:hypothetical protein [Burkholderia gladioli]